MTNPTSRLHPGSKSHAALERTAALGSRMHRIFGTSRPSDLPRAWSPIGLEATHDALLELLRAQAMAPASMAYAVGSLVHAGYWPRRSRRDSWDELTGFVTRAGVANSRRGFELYGERQFGSPSVAVAPAEPLESEILPLGHLQAVIPRATEVVFDGRCFSVQKEVLLQAPLQHIGGYLDPECWPHFGPFFQQTVPLLRHRHSGKPDRMAPPSPAQRKKRRAPDPGKPRQSWHGEILEEFVINWNQLAVQQFEVHLAVEYIATPDAVRSDYSLMYERRDQIVDDRGYVELRRVPGHPTWVRFASRKTLKFASSVMNLTAPAVMATFLEQNSGALENEAYIHTGFYSRERPWNQTARTRPGKSRTRS